jgi:hypothetical protein
MIIGQKRQEASTAAGGSASDFYHWSASGERASDLDEHKLLGGSASCWKQRLLLIYF